MLNRVFIACALAVLPWCGLFGCTPHGDAMEMTASHAPMTLRVMTYNIHTARGVDGKLDLPRIAAIINCAHVDVVALQEVDVRTRRTGTDIDEAAELAKLTGMHGAFGKAIDHDGGDYGQAILSRQPIQEMAVHRLPAVVGEEQRIALVVKIAQPKPLPNLVFVGTHLHYKKGGDALRLSQAGEIEQILKPYVEAKEAVMLLGDFNAEPESDVMKGLMKSWDDATADSGPTIPSEKPERKIDYVLLPNGHGWEVVSAKVLDEPVASDHRPVVVELKWTK